MKNGVVRTNDLNHTLNSSRDWEEYRSEPNGTGVEGHLSGNTNQVGITPSE